MRPISDPAMKMPASVTSRPTVRVIQPLSPANVPESSTRSNDCQNDSPTESPSTSPLTPVSRNTQSRTVATRITASMTSPR